MTVSAGAWETSEARLAAIVACSDDAIMALTLDGEVTDWNQGAEVIFGYAAEEMVGRSITLLAASEDTNDSIGILRRVSRGERVEHYTTKRRRKDGQILDVSLSVSPIRDPEGRLVGVSKVARDITDLIKAQADLAAREAHLKSVLETIPDGMVVIDSEGTIQSFSAAAEHIFGWASAEVVGRNVSLLMPRMEGRRHDGYMRRYRETGQARVVGIGRPVTGLRRDGTTFPIDLAIGEMRAGGTRFFTGFIRDLTEARRTEQRLRDLQGELVHVSRLTALGEMASALSHELNQPLTAISNYLSGSRRVLDSGRPDDLPVARDAIERATEQALRAGEIIRRLREFVTRSESHQRPEPVAKLVEEAGVLALLGAGETTLQVSFTFDPDADRVLVDRIQIQQVLLNLIRNAVEAMEASDRRELSVSSHRIDRHTVRIDVADRGHGVAPDVESQLFRPFTTTKRDGMGVGLSISRTIIEGHGGRLWAEPREGGGSVFRFTLKAAEDAG